MCSPVVRAPDFATLLIIQIGWSKDAFGAILGLGSDDEETVVVYASLRNSPSEQNYAPATGEYLAVRWAVEYFRPVCAGSSLYSKRIRKRSCAS